MVCENCKKEHDGSYGSGRFCSSKCGHSYSAKKNNDVRIDKIRKSTELSIVEGRHHAFTGKEGRIVENYWWQELLKIGLPVKKNYPVECESIQNNNHYYRLDFLVGDNVDLEIDGDVFHQSEKDKVRDDYLTSQGYIVYRVPYVNPKRYPEKFLHNVTEFVKWYNDLGSAKS